MQSRLDGLSPAELRKVRDYEKRNANRKSVLDAVQSKLGLEALGLRQLRGVPEAAPTKPRPPPATATSST